MTTNIILSDDEQLKIVSWHGYSHSQFRITYGGGGPVGMEFLVDSDENGTSLAIWNPWRNEWSRVNLVNLGKSQDAVV